MSQGNGAVAFLETAPSLMANRLNEGVNRLLTAVVGFLGWRQEVQVWQRQQVAGKEVWLASAPNVMTFLFCLHFSCRLLFSGAVSLPNAIVSHQAAFCV